MYTYDKVQPGALWFWLTAFLPLVFLLEPTIRAEWWWMVVVWGVLDIVMLRMFVPFRVQVDSDTLWLKFGIGLIKKKIPLRSVVGVEPAEHKWHYGWGIRLIGNRQWVYALTGRKLVKVSTSDEVVYYIGTEHPYELAAAIRAGMKTY